MKNTTRLAVIALVPAVIALTFAPSVFAKAKVSVVGAADYYGLTEFGSNELGETVKGDLGYGGGLLFELPMSKSVGLELGGIFLKRKVKGITSVDESGAIVSGSTDGKILNAPAALRFTVGRVFSFHAGGFYERAFEDGGSYDYGATAGFRLNIPTRAGAFFIEPRYNHGLKKEDGSTINNKVVLGLVGFSFGSSR